MGESTKVRAAEPAEPVVRSPMDGLWFAVLFVSIAVGIGMTIFAPVGDEKLPTVAVIGSAPATAPADPFLPTTSPTTTTTLPALPSSAPSP
jgi:hypothetical protein